MRARTALLAALVAALAYAAFAHGAARQPGEAWFEVAVAGLALVVAASALLGGPLRPGPAPAGWWGVGLLALFAAWTGASLLWSIAPDRSWEELNRAIAYAGVAGVGLAVGASVPRAVERFAVGWLAVAVAVALYALGGKVLPGVHVHPFFDFDQTGAVARLRVPLEYWNALALLCVLAVPVAVRLVIDVGRSALVRIAGLEALYLFAVVVGLTYSRGGVLAYVVVAAVLTVAGAGRLRGLLAMTLPALAAVVPLAVAFTRLGLKANGEPLGVRISEGRILGAYVLACGALLAGAGLVLLRAEPRVVWSVDRSRRVWRGLAAAAAVLLVLVAVGLARSERGLGGSVSHAFHGFTETKEDRQFDPVRLLSTNSSNRWVWWSEAGGAWSARPLQGWGAGSFALLHDRYRRRPLPVTQAHSVPMQMLAETGLVGLLCAYGGILLLLAAAVARLRGLRPGRPRELGVALVAAAVAWLLHGVYDWDWNIPAVTAPALAMLGVVAGRPAGDRAAARPFADPEGDDRPGVRAVALVVVSLAALAAVAGAALPAWAGAKADAAAATAAEGTPSALEQAAAQADLAARLDPLAVRPLFVGAAIAAGRGRLLDARTDLLRAADREPENPEVWRRLAGLALRLADRRGVLYATRRALDLDPADPAAALLAQRALSFATPPASSATATGTPLAPVAPVAPVAPSPAG
jgi:hypothetical protein